VFLSGYCCCSLGNEPFLKQGIVFAEAEKEKIYNEKLFFREHR